MSPVPLDTLPNNSVKMSAVSQGGLRQVGQANATNESSVQGDSLLNKLLVNQVQQLESSVAEMRETTNDLRQQVQSLAVRVSELEHMNQEQDAALKATETYRRHTIVEPLAMATNRRGSRSQQLSQPPQAQEEAVPSSSRLAPSPPPGQPDTESELGGPPNLLNGTTGTSVLLTSIVPGCEPSFGHHRRHHDSTGAILLSSFHESLALILPQGDPDLARILNYMRTENIHNRFGEWKPRRAEIKAKKHEIITWIFRPGNVHQLKHEDSLRTTDRSYSLWIKLVRDLWPNANKTMEGQLIRIFTSSIRFKTLLGKFIYEVRDAHQRCCERAECQES